MRYYLRDRLILVSVVSGVLINIILWLVFAGKFGFSGDRIPLHFNVVYGIDFLGSARRIYQLPAAYLVILIVNFFLGRMIYDREAFFSYLLSFTAVFAQVVILASALALLILNK